MNFVAIDFEIANEKYESVCSFGIAKVNNGEIVENKSWLIRPHRNFYRFRPINVKIHGIKKEDVEDKPEFNELWNIFKNYFNNNIIIAHGASFDINVLKRVLNLYEIEYPNFKYVCSKLISNNIWKDLKDLKLTSIAEYFNIIFKHHDPKDDAFLSAEIIRRACKYKNVNTIEELINKLNIEFGLLSTYQDKSIQEKKQLSTKIDYEKQLKSKITKSDSFLYRNFKGSELEKKGNIEKAIKLYEKNINENSIGSYPYERLSIIYRKQNKFDEEIRVLEKAIFVYENKASKEMGGRIEKLEKFKKRLERVKKLNK